MVKRATSLVKDKAAQSGSLRLWVELSLLYASKSGGLVVGVLILPWYQKLLGEDEFGAVAVIISLQAFLFMLDLGASTIVGRDLAVPRDEKNHLETWRAAEFVLHIFYIIILFTSASVNFIANAPLSFVQIILFLLLAWSLTVQNVGQSALLAKRYFVVASIIQLIGVLSRAFATIAALYFVRADLEVFLMAQALIGVVQMVVTHYICRRMFYSKISSLEITVHVNQVIELARRGMPLVLFGFSGAAVLQLDKPIIGFFSSPADITPYFLASALCLIPMGVLAAPINQYLFPGIVESISHHKSEKTLRLLQRLIISIFFVVAIPSTILWLWREEIVELWLRHDPISPLVVQYVEILLPATAIGALGFVPYSILIAHEDYRFYSYQHFCLAVFTLMATALVAALSGIFLVAWVYAIYHVLSVFVTWFRASRIVAPHGLNYANRSAIFASYLVLAVIIIVVMLT